jgi:hypothetical protein
MGITPIINLALLPLTRTIGSDLEPLPMERVENSARTGDETYSPSNQESARGPEDGSEDDGPEDGGADDEFQNLAGEDDADPTPHPAAQHPSRQISFFA